MSSSGSVLPVGNSYRNHKRLAYLPVGLDRTYSRRSSSPACAACVAVGRRKTLTTQELSLCISIRPEKQVPSHQGQLNSVRFRKRKLSRTTCPAVPCPDS